MFQLFVGGQSIDVACVVFHSRGNLLRYVIVGDPIMGERRIHWGKTTLPLIPVHSDGAKDPAVCRGRALGDPMAKLVRLAKRPVRPWKPRNSLPDCRVPCGLVFFCLGRPFFLVSKKCSDLAWSVHSGSEERHLKEFSQHGPTPIRK